MLRLFATMTFFIAASSVAMAFFISGGPLSPEEVAAIKARLGRAYVNALSLAEEGAREARDAYCAEHRDSCGPA